ncbi:MAG: uroporphyrinogen-III C-methyltransferase [Planctomycetota bacterium]|nr:MAG: uroporphyrinogen-III C-methyltransferase [Planctomycetota bacterium]
MVRFVGAGPGDPDLITVRGLRALQEADVICYDALGVAPELLEGLRAELIYVGKRCGRHSRSQEEINALLVELAQRGLEVVRLKGGDPGVLGRVGEEALALAAEGIPFEIVPGVSSATSAPLSAGIPLTHRGVADSFALATAHRRKGEEGFSIPPYNERTTVVLLMPVRTARAWQAALLRRGYPRELPVAFVSRGATPAQRVLVSTVGAAAADAEAARITAPTLVVIGRVVGLRGRGLRWWNDRDARECAEEPTRVDVLAEARA